MASAASSTDRLGALPKEVLAWIFDFVPEADMPNLRLVCKYLGQFAELHLFSELSVESTRRRMQNLRDLSKRPHLAVCVLSVYWQADRFDRPTLDRSAWEKQREVNPASREWNWSHEAQNIMKTDDGGLTTEYRDAFERQMKVFEEKCRGNPTPTECDRAYAVYWEESEGQWEMQRTGFEQECLGDLFKACRTLRKITIAIAHGIDGFRRRARTAYLPTMMQPRGDFHPLDQGVYQVSETAKALYRQSRPIKELRLIDISYRLMMSPTDDASMRYMMSGLEELRIIFSCYVDPSAEAGDDDEVFEAARTEMEDQAFDEIRTAYHNNKLSGWLSEARSLRVLKLRMYHHDFDDRCPTIKSILGSSTWPGLAQLALRQFSATTDDLVALLLRHQKSLQYVYLADIDLTTDGWLAVFLRIAGKMKSLEAFYLDGTLSEDGDVVYAFQDARDRFEQYVLDPTNRDPLKPTGPPADPPSDTGDNNVDDEDDGHDHNHEGDDREDDVPDPLERGSKFFDWWETTYYY
ncbi:hypothetical protein AC578_10182 [Lecanosticta acicola]|uniref:F-box domain-containing protein n=1 Tax=Lecanosticta acicola TaxID=111012 RepID=A0AAI9EC89_9PEZI|nr:hypothetical protein AC578_10182 [Lecanosticta acicola]